jgi:hypothetical protein
MRASNLLLLCAAAALPLSAQVIASGEHWPGVQIHFDAKIEPPPSPTTDPAILRQLERDVHGGVIGSHGVHRYWRDAEQKMYLGYDVSVEPGSRPQVFRIRIAPLTLSPGEMAESGLPETWTRLSLPKYPVIPDVRVNDTVAIDLLANPLTGQKIVDYLTLQRIVPPTPPHPRDFTLSDAGLSVNDPRITIDGKLVEATAHVTGGISGPTVWFYLQGRGRFVLSLVRPPDTRFRRAGEVSDNTLTFRGDEGEYRIECSSRIAPSPGHFNLYVFHDSAWRPAGEDANASFLFGSFTQEGLKGK